MKRILLTTALALLVATGLSAREVDRSVDATADSRVDISNISGSITVEGWANPEVRVTGELDDGVERLEFRNNGGRIRIEVKLPSGRNVRGGSADLTIYVPFGVELEVSTVSANIEVSGLEGELELHSVSGGIEISGSPQTVEAESVSGSVDVKANSILADGNIQTVSGRIRFAGGLDPEGRFEFESVSGSIRLDLPSGTSADLELSTFSGSIRGEGIEARSGGFGVDTSVTIGSSGGARVSAQTFSGSIRIGSSEVTDVEVTTNDNEDFNSDADDY